MKMYKHQKELLESKEDKIIVNWPRGSGKDAAIMFLLGENKYKNVYMPCSKFTLKRFFNKLVSNIEEIDYRKIREIDHNVTESTIILTFLDGTESTIHSSWSSGNVDLLLLNNEEPDYYEQSNAIKTISFVTTNNYDKHLESNYKEYKVFNIDYRDLMDESILHIDTLISSARGKYFYKEYAIKDNEPEIELDDFKYKALQRLQKQFLDTADTKDTVLTRKNLLDMIRYLAR